MRETLFGKRHTEPAAEDAPTPRYYRIAEYADGAMPVYALMVVDERGEDIDLLRDSSARSGYWSLSREHARAMISGPIQGAHFTEWKP